MHARPASLLLLILASAGPSLPGCAPKTGSSEAPQAASAAAPKADDALPAPADFLKEAKLEASEGLFTTYRDHEAGRVLVRVDAETPRTFLYYEGLATGLGANPAGLDRGEIGDSQILRLRRVGRRVLLEAVNTRFIASSDNEAERRAAADAFPNAVLWAGDVVASDDELFIFDLSSFLVRDAHQVSLRLHAREEGEWALDPERSVVQTRAALSFPDNLEFEATLSFGTSEPGDWSGSTSPSPTTLSFRQHHSFVRLPDDKYTPRLASPRMGNMSVGRLDFAVPLEQPLEQSLAIRHRLMPDAPLVYYVDPGAPLLIRKALIEGASWWAEAFEQAGHKGGFEVRVLPDGAHPLDVRYNVINWVHRSTRGWSYGASVVDPRTGEIIKGHVTLGSQRARQDRRIFEALVGSAQSGKGGPDDPVQLALARIRQLAAHEVGHTLGFEHNFAASTWISGRASVMDYPAPWIHLEGKGPQAKLDLSDAYAVGIGAWDLMTARYLYGEWPSAAARDAALAKLIAEAERKAMLHMSDAETHAAGASHPAAAVWDNGADPVAALDEIMAVRAHALSNFGPDRLAKGADPSDLELTFAPLYLLHRFQVVATARSIGGRLYALGPALDDAVHMVAPKVQLAALSAVLATLKPAALESPKAALEWLRPTPNDYIDAVNGWTGPSYDPLGLAASAIDMSLGTLLDPWRAQRMELGHARDAQQPSFAQLLSLTSASLFTKARGATPTQLQLQWLSIDRYAEALVRLAANNQASPQVRALAEKALTELKPRLRRAPKAQAAYAQAIERRVTRWIERREDAVVQASRAPAPPPGSPIGEPAQACGVGG